MNLGEVLTGVGAIVVTLAILFVLVIVHELGHFVVARRFHVKVHEFGIGFPPRARILGRDRETLYTLNWLPIGGFVRLEGEDGGDRSDPRSFASQSLGKRVVILAAGVAMNLLLAVVILVGVAALADPSVVLRFRDAGPGTLAADLGLSAGDSLEAVDGRRFSFFDGEDPTADLAAKIGKQAVITVGRADGSVVDRTVTLSSSAGIRIGLVQDDSPAAAVGLRAGDVILKIDGKPFGYLSRVEASNELRSHAGQPVTLSVQHPDGSTTDVVAVLRPASDIGPDRGALGVRFDPGSIDAVAGPPVRRDALAAVQKGVARTAQALGLVLGALGSLVGTVASNPTQAPPVSGPIGITFFIGNLLQSYPPVFLLYMTGVLSANLALINILPLPPLDGGRIAVITLQRALGNRISGSAERLAYFLGFVFFLGLLLWISYFDVLRNIQGGP